MGLANRWRTGLGVALIVVAATAGNLMMCRSSRDGVAHRGEREPHRVTPALTRESDSQRSAPPPVGALRLEGQVIDEQEQPVESAVIELSKYDAHTTSAADGSFAFDRLAGGAYSLTARKGEDTYSEPTEIKLTGNSEPAIIKLQPAASITVHVQDAENRAGVAGATVHDASGKTDEHGVIVLHGLAPSKTAFIFVEADGYEPAMAHAVLAPDASAKNEVTIKLHHGVPVSGTVVDPDGRPVTDAWVRCDSPGSMQNAKLDSTGAWRIPAVAAGPHSFRAGADTFKPTPDVVLDLDGVHPKDGVVLRVEPAGYVVATVVDETGAVVEGANVEVRNSFAGWSNVTDRNGVARVKAFELGTVKLLAHTDTRVSTLTVVSVNAPKRFDVRIVIAPSTISGTVVDSRGSRVEGARVYLDARGSLMQDTSAASDAKGHFELGAIEPGTYKLYARRGDQEHGAGGDGVEAKAGASDVKIVVSDVGTVSGRVLRDGKPVPQFSIYLRDTDQYLFSPTTVRSADGRFTLRGVAAGTWNFAIAGAGLGRTDIEHVEVHRGQDHDLGDIAVSKGREVHGRVTDSDGQPVAGATVVVHDEAHTWSSEARDPLEQATQGLGTAVTDAGGMYHISGLAPPLGLSSYKRHIVATHPSRGTSIERVLGDDDTTIDLVITAAGGIDGKIDGESERQITCMRMDDRTFGISADADESGRFHFDNLAPGLYRLRVYASAPASTLVTVVGGQRASVVIPIVKERVLVTVHTTGAPCRFVGLETDDAARDAITGWPCREPDVELGKIAPGPYRLCVNYHCAPITIPPAPAQQTLTVQALP